MSPCGVHERAFRTRTSRATEAPKHRLPKPTSPSKDAPGTPQAGGEGEDEDEGEGEGEGEGECNGDGEVGMFGGKIDGLGAPPLVQLLGYSSKPRTRASASVGVLPSAFSRSPIKSHTSRYDGRA